MISVHVTWWSLEDNPHPIDSEASIPVDQEMLSIPVWALATRSL